MPQRQEEQRTRRPLVPLREEATQDRDVLVVGNRNVVVVADEEAVEAGLGRGPRPFDHPAGADARIHRCVPAPQRNADIHEGSFAR